MEGCPVDVGRVLLTRNPTSSDDEYSVFVIYGDSGGLGFWRSRADRWRNVGDAGFVDVALFRGEVCALGFDGRILCVGFDGEGKVRMRGVPLNVKLMLWCAMGGWGRKHLVVCGGRLVIVCEVMTMSIGFSGMTTGVGGFRVHEVDVGSGEAVPVEDLGGRALFVGRNETICAEGVETYGCWGNCMYYIGGSEVGGDHVIRIFPLEKGSRVERIETRVVTTDASPAIWIEPSYI